MSQAFKKIFPAAAVLILGCVFAAALSVAVAYLFYTIADSFVIRFALYRQIAFYLIIFIVGVLFTLIDFKRSGWSVKGVIAEWKWSLWSLTLTLSVVLLYLFIGPTNPFYGMNWPVYTLSVIGEECIFRGFLFGLMLEILSKRYDRKTAVLLTILFNSAAFSCWHLPNLFSIPLMFVLFQLIYTFAFGALWAFIRSKTDSLIPPILCHFAVNCLATIIA